MSDPGSCHRKEQDGSTRGPNSATRGFIASPSITQCLRVLSERVWPEKAGVTKHQNQNHHIRQTFSNANVGGTFWLVQQTN